MIPVLEFVFRSFWTWAGCVVLIASAGVSVAVVIEAVRGGQS